MARSTRRGSRLARPLAARSPHVSRVLEVATSDPSLGQLSRLLHRDVSDLGLLVFTSLELANGREPMDTITKCHQRDVEALDAVVTKPIKLSDDTIVERSYVDHSRRMEASARLLARVGVEQPASRASGGNILLYVQLADGSQVQVGAVGAPPPDRDEPRAVGPGANGGGA